MAAVRGTFWAELTFPAIGCNWSEARRPVLSAVGVKSYEVLDAVVRVELFRGAAEIVPVWLGDMAVAGDVVLSAEDVAGLLRDLEGMREEAVFGFDSDVATGVELNALLDTLTDGPWGVGSGGGWRIVYSI